MPDPSAQKQDIRDLSFDELALFLRSINEPAYRTQQIFDWIYKKGARSFDSMTNLSAGLKERLISQFRFYQPRIDSEDLSEDMTRKALFHLEDGEKIETVLIPTDTRATVCVSTQAGCKFGCRFCASGIGGWVRNLTPAEILEQVLYMKNSLKKRALSNIVFMGVGEPLDNYDNLMKAIRVINSEQGIHLGARKITISTCGVIPRIRQLAKEGLQLELAVSLHGYSNESRDVLMPVNRKYPMEDLVAACREYAKSTKRQITFEYILIKGVTCTDEAARELGRHLRGMLCKMNLIPYNPVKEFSHETPSRTEMISFQKRLDQQGIHATIRTPRGRDVSAACGQLRHSSRPEK